jgi:hypothetical protein
VENYPRDLAEFERAFGNEELCQAVSGAAALARGFHCPRCHGQKAPARAGLLW